MESLSEFLPLALILSVGVFVQSAAGFAAGLLIVPSLLWCGYSIPEAQTALLVATIPQNAWGVWKFRDCLTPKQIAWPGLGRLVFLPLGVWALQNLESVSITTLRQIVGGFVLTATLATIYFRPVPRARLHPGWAFLAFPLSGFFQGVVGMGGPAMVFWVQAHDWDTRQIRGFLFGMYLISLAPALTVLYLFFGDRIIGPGIAAAALTPWLIVVTNLGLRFGTRLGRQRLRLLTLGLLLMLGVSGLASPWLR
ncbi:TSUP family transporter [Crateriforma conspicua]|uniref:Probable membrane transporter protein n=1 Tax=Crateriforma conspicua TaxID=2527996 RepID=A0A5C6FM40_9PLAN|nr:TSUP family transporter [Crateriforma conspicua]TWU61708.1 Sulfite exporter TauE/SafE [Crateriforma conspicua]